MDPLTATRTTPTPAPSLYRSPLTGIDVQRPVSFSRDNVTFDGDGRISQVDFGKGTSITVRSANQKDSIEMKATFYELALGSDGPYSISLPGLEGALKSEIADTAVTVRGGISVGSLTAPGVFSEARPDGTSAYRLELGPLGMDLEREHGIALLDHASTATDAVYDRAKTFGGFVVDEFDRLGDGLAAAWRWARGAPAPAPAAPPTRFVSSPSDPSVAGDVARDARFIAPFSKAAYAGESAPAGALHEDISHLFDPSDGFSAELFHARRDGRNLAILSLRGTEDLRDGITDVAHAVMVPSQFVQAVNLAAAVRERYPDREVVLTGHSLGAALASFAGLMTGTRAVAVDSAGPQVPTLLQLPENADYDLVTHINTEGDPLTGLAGAIAGRRWGNTVCTIDESGRRPKESDPEFLQSLRNRTVTVAQILEHHRIVSATSKLAEPDMQLNCVRYAS